MDLFKKVFKQTSWQVLGKTISSISTLIILALITRNYGEEGTGLFILALTYLALFTLAVDFGINAYLMPWLSKNDYQTTLRKLFGLRILLAIIFILAGLFGIMLWPTNIIVKKIVLIGIIPAVFEPAIFLCCNAFFQSRLRYDLSTAASSAGSLLILLLTFFLVQASLPIDTLIWSYNAGWIAIALLSLVFLRGFIRNLLPDIDLNFIKSTLIHAWPISATLLLSMLYFRADLFILSIFKQFYEVGVYSLAYQFFQAALVLPTFIMNAYYPLMLKSFNENTEFFKKQIIKASLIMLGLATAGSLLTAIFSPLIINTITGGKGFMGSPEALKILSLGFPAYFLSALFMWVLVVLKKYKTMLVIYALGFTANVTLNLIFIPMYSYRASAWITGVSEYLILFLLLLMLKKHLWN